MVEALMLWNEPNNLSHWDFKLDPDWNRFAAMVIAASHAVRRENPGLPIVLGGISPIDPNFIELMGSHGVLDAVDVVAVRSEEHTSELQSHLNLVCRLLLEKKKKYKIKDLST